MGWTAPTEEEFNGWIMPRDALGALPQRIEGGTKRRWIMARLQGGMVIAVGRSAQRNFEDPIPFTRVATRYWQMWDDWGDDDFWELGDAVFIQAGAGGYGSVRSTFRFFDVRFDPASFSGRPPAPAPDALETPKDYPGGATWVDREYDSNFLPAADPASPPTPEPPPSARNRGGRPSGKHGEPIARITMRLVALPPEKLAAYTAAALALELIEEFKRLTLDPPSLANAERDAAGILRAVRN